MASDGHLVDNRSSIRIGNPNPERISLPPILNKDVWYGFPSMFLLLNGMHRGPFTSISGVPVLIENNKIIIINLHATMMFFSLKLHF